MTAAGALFRGLGRMLFSASQGAAAVAQTTIARFLIVGINLCTGIITARGLGSAGRGEMSAIVLWPGFLAYVLTLGLPAAIRYWVRRDPERSAEFLTVSLGAALGTSLIAVVVGVAFIPVWLHNYSGEVVRLAQIMMFTAPEIMIALMLSGMMESLGRFSAANASRYVPTAMTLAILVVLLLAHAMTPFAAALAYTVPPVLAAFWMAWKLRAYITFRLFDPRPALRLLGSYGARSYGIDILSTLAAQIDQVLVIALLSASDVGVYVVALSASRVINVLHAAVVTVLFPSATGLAKEDVLAMVGRSARISTGIAAAFSIVLAAAYPVLFPLFYGHAFDAAVGVAQLLTLEALLIGLVVVLTQAFMALGRPGYVTALQALGLAIVLPAMLVLLPRFGLIGAALALLASTTFRLVLILLSFPLVLHVRVPELVPTRDDFARVRQALVRS
jgi:antigen flippase